MKTCPRKPSLGLIRFTLFWITLALSHYATARESIAPPLNDTIAKQAKHLTSDTGAKVLLRKAQISVAPDLRAETIGYVAIAINDASAARDYSQITLSFNDHYESLSLDFARVRTPEGQLEPLADDATQIQNPGQENFYQDTKELSFSLPNIRPGSVIEYQYRSQDKASIVPGVFFAQLWTHRWQAKAANQGPRFDAVAEYTVQVQTPKSVHLYAEASASHLFKFKKTNDGEHTLWQWRATDLPAVQVQGWMPRGEELIGNLTLSTSNSWADIKQWAEAITAPHIITTNTIRQIAQTIAPANASREAKIQAVYAYLDERIRYVFAHVGRGGYEPHSATDVVKNGYGDCKDQTILAVSLLRALGVEAYPALVVTRSQGTPKLRLPGVYFDHMITYIPSADSQDIWLDTTGEAMHFPGAQSMLYGQPALVIDGKNSAIFHIPTLDEHHHVAQMQLTVSPPAVGEPLSMVMHLKVDGLFEESLRSTWRYSAEKEKAISDTFAGMFAKATLKDLKVINARELNQNLEITGRWEFENDWHNDPAQVVGFSIAQIINMFTGFYQWHKPEQRLQPFEFDPGITLRSQVIYRPNAQGQLPEKITAGANIKTPWFTLTQSHQAHADRIVADSNLVIPTQRFSLEQYKAFYNTLNALQDEASFSVGYSGFATEQLTETAALSPAQVRLLLKHGRFAQALDSAQALVAKDNTNGEYHYLLGLAQGYNDLILESAGSLDLAERLGYQAP